MSDKIAERHLQRKALVYVRQSTLQQLSQSEESRRLQYAMQERVRELGWRSVEVIDDDLGCSAAGSADRPGFRRPIAEVSLGGIGAVAARELSRFARNSRDWQQLVEVCRFVDTVLVDQECIYDPRNSNDRLLLGLKGSLSEYELELLRLRASEARIAKARRGEFLTIVPVGFCRNEDGEIEKDPDMRVQLMVSLLFEKALEFGGARGAMRWFRDHELKLPAGPMGRKSRATVEWKTPHYTRVLRMLRNPTYAGAYAYGRRQSVPSFEDGRPQVKVQRRARDEWLVLLEDHHEGYLSWRSFERLQAMIDPRNAQARWQTAPGAAKKGSALLSGLLRCRRCGRKLQVRYDSRKKDKASARYGCDQASVLSGADPCISFGAVDTYRRVSEELLAAVSPAALRAAELAHREHEDKQDELLDALETELQAARYAADRASRQYNAADPENRLVAGELERRWEVSLAAVHDLEGRLEAARRNRTEEVAADSSLLREMAEDLRKVWDDPRSDNKTKKRLARTLIEEILADVDEQGGMIELVVHWKGGVHTGSPNARRDAREARHLWTRSTLFESSLSSRLTPRFRDGSTGLAFRARAETDGPRPKSARCGERGRSRHSAQTGVERKAG